MPPRFLSLTILAFWLATMGWLVYRDLWPWVQPGDPPPYTIDLADEARQFGLPTRWGVYRLTDKEERLGRLRTWVEYRASDDTFALHSEMERVRLALSFEIGRLASFYRVDREGRLQELQAHFTVSLGGREVTQGSLEGQVHEQQFHATGRVGPHEFPLQPVPVSASGSMLNPLHPVNRIAGLRPGQAWRMPLIDPLTDALAATLPVGAAPTYLDARVLTQTEELPWSGRAVTCLVVEYHHGSERVARTWCRAGDGLVLRQEASLKGELLRLQRE